MSKEVRQLGLIGLVIIAVVAIIGGVAWYRQSTAPEPTDAKVRADSHAVGPADAAVTLVEFGDYQCPACAQTEPVVEQIRRDYADKSFRFVFRHFPLAIHPNAPAAANAAEAAAAQGKFWEMNDILYANQNAWASSPDPTQQFEQYAKEIGVSDLKKFENDVKSSAFASRVRADQKDGNALAVQATPTFFLNDEKLEGGQSYADLKAKIDALLAKHESDQASPSAQEASASAQP
jgi:protein-disulfide isomerase